MSKLPTGTSTLNICFEIMGNDLWVAGHVYLRYLCTALTRTYPDSVNLFLANRTGRPLPRHVLDFIPGATLIYGESSCEDRILPRSPFTAPQSNSPDLALTAALKAHSVGLYFGSPYAVSDPSIKTISLMVDFQHMHFPQFFSGAERRHRDRYFNDVLERADIVLIPGESQRESLRRFQADLRGGISEDKVKVYHPVAALSDDLLSPLDNKAREKYHLPERFFFLPNQFWRHKNHKLLVEALSILKQEGKHVFTALSGSSYDYRFPTLFAELFAEISANGIGSMVTYLGTIPHTDVPALMQESLAVINPSMYEGFALTVEEAKALGVPLLVSDIPTHHERKAENCRYFSLDDPRELSKLLWTTWSEGSQVAPARDRRKHSEYITENARQFVAICNNALKQP